MILQKLDLHEYSVGGEVGGADFLFESFNSADEFLFANGYVQSNEQPDYNDGIWYYEKKGE